MTGQLLRTTRPTTVGEGGRKCPLGVRLLMLGRLGNKLSQANEMVWPWRPEVGAGDGSLRVVQTSITPNFEKHPPSP